ncbi:kinase/pyrophosphorylase, partial [Selenomonadales bacterium OttesenSCG-928-I06]|nr:kinase/pyrophosphorylase [Selenomonadales bacterium OttesenSCG-928-I06]
MSDSIGETAESVAVATASQFSSDAFKIIRVPYINSAEKIAEVVKDAADEKCVICHTLVSPELRKAFQEETNKYGITSVDIMGPMMNSLQEISGLTPLNKPGKLHELDNEYFKRVEAIEFAVKYDDGKNPQGLKKADVVLVGVSRTSKTPLSMYLAHKSVKAANLPMVPEATLPKEIFEVPKERIIGLIIDPSKLVDIREERLKTMGLPTSTSYANLERIYEELDYAKGIMNKLG